VPADGEPPTTDALAVPGLNGGLRLLAALHLGEAEPFRAACGSDHDDRAGRTVPCAGLSDGGRSAGRSSRKCPD
jgi:hypothetical protein